MKEKLRFLGLDVHAETIAVAVAEPEGEVCKRRSKNRPYYAARAGWYGGVKVDHRRRVSFMSCCGTAGFMGHRRDVQGGTLRACAASGAGGGWQ